MTAGRRLVVVLLIASGIALTWFAIDANATRQRRVEKICYDMVYYSGHILPVAHGTSIENTPPERELLTASEKLTLWADELLSDAQASSRERLLLGAGQVAWIAGLLLIVMSSRTVHRSAPGQSI